MIIDLKHMLNDNNNGTTNDNNDTTDENKVITTLSPMTDLVHRLKVKHGHNRNLCKKITFQTKESNHPPRRSSPIIIPKRILYRFRYQEL